MKDTPFRQKIYEIIFEAETPKGKTFDITLILLVIFSIIVVILESVESLQAKYLKTFLTLEWILTIIFSIEYILRIYCVSKPFKYIFSFYGLVDIFSIIPTYLSVLVPGAQSMLVIRALRLLRIFRVLKLSRYANAGNFLSQALIKSRPKIIVFLGAIVTLVCIMGTMMYIIEGKENGFSSIPKGIYWAIVTMTTVGYGDISPNTPLGQFFASMLMIAGYGIIAVPTGIVTSEMTQAQMSQKKLYTKACRSCTKEEHDFGAAFCNHCGTALPQIPE